MKNFIAAMLLLGSLHSLAQAQTIHPDLEYAHSGQRPLLLDLYLPATQASPTPVVVWLYGGAWRAGNKSNPQFRAVVDHGYALAAIDFRNSPEATFPAQAHDIKAAIRYLRANAQQYGLDPARFAIGGYSSGGHLAALVGVSNGNRELEGNLGQHLDTSSDVQAILDYAGPTNFETILYQSTAHGVNVREPSLALLLGKPVDDPTVQDLARLASPVHQVHAGSPPLLVMHGMQDNQVPINQPMELQAVYQAQGLHVESVWIPQATHGSGEYFQPEYLGKAIDFLQRAMP